MEHKETLSVLLGLVEQLSAGALIERSAEFKAIPATLSHHEIANLLVGAGVNDAIRTDLVARVLESRKQWNTALPLLQRLSSEGNRAATSRMGVALSWLHRTEEADCVFDQVIELDPESYWGHFERAMVPFRSGDYVAAKERLGTLIRVRRDRHEGFLRYADAAGELRLWHLAGEALGQMMNLFPWSRDLFSARIRTVAHYTRLSELAAPSDLPLPLVINLDQDAARFGIMAGWYNSINQDIERLPAVQATSLPRFVLNRLPVAPKLSLGTVGCFLSHTAAWERVAVQRVPRLILEDDAYPPVPVAGAVSLLLQRLPEDFDLCFLNSDMMVPPEALDEVETDIAVRPAAMTASLRPAHQRGVGFQGYLLSAHGAKKLLKFAERDGVLGHVDWQALSYCISTSQASDQARPGVFFEMLSSYIARRREAHHLNAFCVFPSLVFHRDGGYSTRRAPLPPQV